MNYDINKVNKGKKGEAIVLNELKGIFGDSALFFQNVLVFPKNNSKPFECDIICVSRRGLFVFEVKNWEGHIEGDLLSQKWGFKAKGEDHFTKLDNPVMQNNIHRRVLSEFLGENIVSVVVLNNIANHFTINKYSQDQVTVPVLLTTELRTYFQVNYREDVFSDQQFYDLFSKLKDMENKSNNCKAKFQGKDNVTDSEFLEMFSKDNHNVIVDNKNDKTHLTNEQIVKTFTSIAPDTHRETENVIPFPNTQSNQTYRSNSNYESAKASETTNKSVLSEKDSVKITWRDRLSSNIKNIFRKKKRTAIRTFRDIVRIVVLGLIPLILLFLPWTKINNFFKQGIDWAKRVKESSTIQSEIAIPETIQNRHKYTIEELSDFSVATAPEYQEGKMSLCQSFTYRTISSNYVEDHETKSFDAPIYVTPVEYITGNDAQEYYNYLSQKYKFTRPLRQADNEYYAVVRMYVWFLSDTIESSAFDREAYEESQFHLNKLIRFFIDDGNFANSNYYLSNETGQNEYLVGYYVEDLDGNAIKNSEIRNGVPIEVIYLIPLSGDFKYKALINPDYYAHYGSSRARLILD